MRNGYGLHVFRCGSDVAHVIVFPGTVTIDLEHLTVDNDVPVRIQEGYESGAAQTVQGNITGIFKGIIRVRIVSDAVENDGIDFTNNLC